MPTTESRPAVEMVEGQAADLVQAKKRRSITMANLWSRSPLLAALGGRHLKHSLGRMVVTRYLAGAEVAPALTIPLRPTQWMPAMAADPTMAVAAAALVARLTVQTTTSLAEMAVKRDLVKADKEAMKAPRPA